MSEHHEQLVKASVKEFRYDEMKNQLKKIFGDKESGSSSFDNLEVKPEAVFELSMV